QGPTFERIENGQRNEFFGKLARTVIVRAIGYDGWEPECVMPGAHQMIGAGFARRIGRVGCIGRFFAEGAVSAKRTIDLIRRNMNETEPFASRALERVPVSACGIEQGKGSDEIGLNEIRRAIDRTVDMAFCSEMKNAIRLKFRQKRR